MSVTLITIDCLRADHMGCYGYSRDTTPNIDSLASKGTRFSYAFSNGPGTRFAFKSINFGRYPLQVNGAGLPSEQGTTIAELCEQNGFRTGAFVNNGFLTSAFNHNRGFDTFLEVEDWKDRSSAAQDMDNVAKSIGAKLPTPLYSISKRIYYWLQSFAESSGITFETTDREVVNEALDWLKEAEKSNDEYFIWIHLMDPHAPFRYLPDHLEELSIPPSKSNHVYDAWDAVIEGEQPDQDLIDTYDANIRSADAAVGELLQEVEDTTDIIITADHGEEFGTHGEFHRVSVFNSMAHVPLIIVSKDQMDSVKSSPVSLVDIPTTIADMINAKKPQNWVGESLLNNPSDSPIFIGYEFPNYIEGAVVDPPYKLWVRSRGMDKPFQNKMLTNIIDDDETSDYSSEHPDIADKLKEKWDHHFKYVKKTRISSGKNTWDPDSKLDPDEIKSGDKISTDVIDNLEDLGYIE